MTNGLHADELRIDGDLVSTLISTQFPQFAALPLRRLDAFGSTNVLFRLGDELGFVLPVPRNRLEAYRRLVEAVSEIWKEHGALDYGEYVGDDVMLEGTRSFTDALAATADEAIVFGWVAFESREARDVANRRVAADPRMASLIAASNVGFEGRRMAYGGFESFVPSVEANAG